MPQRKRKPVQPIPTPDTLGKRSTWPKLSKADQETIGNYLLGWMAIAIEALEQSQAMFDAAPGTPGFETQRNYWRNVVSGLKWAFDHLPHRQRYLQALKVQQPQPNGKP